MERTDVEFNAHKTIELNTNPATEDAAIANGWYPEDGGVAGTNQKVVPVPPWLEAVMAKSAQSDENGDAKEGDAKEGGATAGKKGSK